MRGRLLLLTLFLFSFPWLSEAQFSIGYNTGVYTSAARNFKAHALEFNTAAHADDLKQEIRITPFYRGLSVGLGMRDRNWYFGFFWNSKKMHSNYGEYADTRVKWRFKYNAIAFEGALGNDVVKVGLSTEVGVVKAQKRVLKDGEHKLFGGWEPFYDEKILISSGYIAGTCTLFLQFWLGKSLELRPEWQFGYSGGAIAVQNLRYQRYVHKPNNVGISLKIWMGGR